MQSTYGDRLNAAVLRLSAVAEGEESVSSQEGCPLPSLEALKRVVALVRDVVFPDFFDKRQAVGEIRQCVIGMAVEQLGQILQTQIARGLAFGTCATEEEVTPRAAELTVGFIERLPEIKRLLYTDVDAMLHNDPAVTGAGEVIFCYPMVQALIHYRMAHELLVMGVPIIPRIISEIAHSRTGIDIHPGATIGEYFCIDHGTGIVIGETCIIGNHVMLYQGVTLGAKSFSRGDNGMLLNVPRHPIIEDNVTIYSNASILGRITIGHDTVVGGNVWLTHSVAPGSVILQSRVQNFSFSDGAGI